MGKIWMLCLMGTMGAMGIMGCGGDKTPVEKCDDLVHALCGRTVACLPELGTSQECVQALQSVLPCGATKSVTSSYDRCLSQLDSASCAALFPRDPTTGALSVSLPADCAGVLKSTTARAVDDAPVSERWPLDGVDELAAPPER